MSVALQTIEEYITKINKKGFWISFNTHYNEAVIKRTPLRGFLDKKYTCQKARDEFLEFMQTNFPNTKLTPIFDNMPLTYLEWQFLGSIAIDCNENDEVYEALNARYEDENGNPKSMEAVFYSMELEIAQRIHKERSEMIEAEFGF